MNLKPLAVWVLLVLAAGAWAEEADEEATEAEIKLEDAHRTVLRRFSVTGAAETRKLLLSSDATAFVDLHLDLQRNLDERKAGRQRKSRIFPLPPTHAYEMKDDGLHLQISSGSFVIDTARLPAADIVETFRRALDPGRFDAARVSTDDRDRFAAHRRKLVQLLMRHAGERIERSSGWGRSRVTAGRDMLRGVDENPEAAGSYLDLLGRVGGEDLADDLLGRIAKAEDDEDAAALRRYRNALCSITGPTARVYVEELLRGDDERARLDAMFYVRQELSPDVMALLTHWAAGLDQDERQRRFYGALTALRRMDTKASWKALEKALDLAEDERFAHRVAMALSREGHARGRACLKRHLRELEQRKDPASVRRAAAIRVLLDLPARR